MTIEVFLAGVVGSLITVIITKLLDLIQKSKEHKYALQKTFFDRKLAVAENAYSKLYLTSSVLSSLSALYDKFSAPNGKTMKVFDLYNTFYTNKLSGLEESISDISNSLFLYFDFDLDMLRQTEPLKKFYDILTDIHDIKITLEVLNELGVELANTDNASYIDAEKEREREKILSKLKELALFFKDNREEILDILKKIKKELKKYSV